MREQLVLLDTAKLAKRKGFNWKVCDAFVVRGKRVEEEDSYLYNHNGGLNMNPLKDNRVTKIISRPSQSLLQKWLRDVHNIHIAIGRICFDIQEGLFWEIQVGKIVADSDDFVEKVDCNYEEALEKGLYEALKLL